MGVTAQDQQSRADFEAFWRKEMNVEAMDLARTNYPMTPPEKQQYLCHETNRAWITWQAARALPAGMEPVGYLIDWPDEPDLGHYFAEGASTTGRSQPLHTAAQVLAMGRVPPEWQAVPVEPTGEMLLAIMSSGEVDVLRETPERHQVLLIDGAGIPDRYAAMLAAAPRPPAAQERKPLTDE